jgi:hypothetical protein
LRDRSKLCLYIVDKQQRVGRTTVEQTGEERGAVDVYGTVTMNYIQLSAYILSGEGTSNL